MPHASDQHNPPISDVRDIAPSFPQRLAELHVAAHCYLVDGTSEGRTTQHCHSVSLLEHFAPFSDWLYDGTADATERFKGTLKSVRNVRDMYVWVRKWAGFSPEACSAPTSTWAANGEDMEKLRALAGHEGEHWEWWALLHDLIWVPLDAHIEQHARATEASQQQQQQSITRASVAQRSAAAVPEVALPTAGAMKRKIRRRLALIPPVQSPPRPAPVALQPTPLALTASSSRTSRNRPLTRLQAAQAAAAATAAVGQMPSTSTLGGQAVPPSPLSSSLAGIGEGTSTGAGAEGNVEAAQSSASSQSQLDFNAATAASASTPSSPAPSQLANRSQEFAIARPLAGGSQMSAQNDDAPPRAPKRVLAPDSSDVDDDERAESEGSSVSGRGLYVAEVPQTLDQELWRLQRRAVADLESTQALHAQQLAALYAKHQKELQEHQEEHAGELLSLYNAPNEALSALETQRVELLDVLKTKQAKQWADLEEAQRIVLSRRRVYRIRDRANTKSAWNIAVKLGAAKP